MEKMQELYFLFLCLIISAHSSQWTYSVNLSNKVRLSWTLNESVITFYVEARTRGYIGIGFSNDGTMNGADILLGWVDDNTGRAYFGDYHGTHNGAPKRDESQDIELLGSEQNSTHTSLLFSRPWHTCDHEHDIQLSEDTIKVIWAIHKKDPESIHSLLWHGKSDRGSKSVYLKNSPTTRYKRLNQVSRIRHWDIKMSNLRIPDNMDTLYWCKIFKLPALGKKHHLIGYTPLIDNVQKGSVHHIILYECVSPTANLMFPRYVAHDGAACYSPSMPADWENCITPVVAWAVGSEGEFLPEHVGIPLSESENDTFFMLEVHYDNPTFKTSRDNSGIRIHFTDSIRTYDGGVMSTGISVTPLHFIPPYQSAYTSSALCNQACTKQLLPDEGVKIVSIVLHTHLAGRQVKVRHIRGNTELTPIAQDNSYDFKYQQARVLSREINLRPGDEIITECVYNTENRTEPTFGGYSTKEEMCLAYMLYYPRTNLAVCNSMTPVQSFFSTLGIEEFYDTDISTLEKMLLQMGSREQIDSFWHSHKMSGIIPPAPGTPFPDFPPEGGHIDDEANQKAINALKSMKEYTLEPADGSGNINGIFGDLKIKRPYEFQNKSFASHLVEMPWAETLLTQRIEESFNLGSQMVFCRKRDDQLARPADIYEFPNVTKLSKAVLPMQNVICPTRKEVMLEQFSYNSASPLHYSVHVALLIKLTFTCILFSQISAEKFLL